MLEELKRNFGIMITAYFAKSLKRVSHKPPLRDLFKVGLAHPRVSRFFQHHTMPRHIEEEIKGPLESAS
jgi:hypothetical protein